MLTRQALGLDPPLASLMSRHPITIAASESVAAAAERLQRCHIRHLPVVDQHDALVGIISVRDVVPADASMRVAEIMTRALQTAAPAERVSAACERMVRHRISGLPVLDGDRLVGIFTATDALHDAAARLSAHGAALPVHQLMTPKPMTTIAPTAPLVTAWAIMRHARVRHLAVMAGGSLAGILSDRDVLAAGRAWLDDAGHIADDDVILVADAMSSRVATIAAEADALDAAHILLRRRFGALPVVRGRDVVGMLTVSDFLCWILSWR